MTSVVCSWCALAGLNNRRKLKENPMQSILTDKISELTARHSAFAFFAVGCALLFIFGLAEASQAAPEINDRSISDAVEDQLLLDHAVWNDWIDMSTDDGIVTLSGSVDNILAKERAVRIAEKVKGVRAVIDLMEVNPPMRRTDSEIQTDVEQALNGDSGTGSYDIGVRVKDNIVTLIGTVDSWLARRFCASVAKKSRAVVKAFQANVRGVTADKLEVRFWSRSNALQGDKYKNLKDSDIQQALFEALLSDPRVADFNVVPEVIAGRATLRGTVAARIFSSMTKCGPYATW
jgi:osmotically-inducible protein OsmY